MKFWTQDASNPDAVMMLVEMIQCHVCSRWLPPDNMELHGLYHKQQQQQQNESEHAAEDDNEKVNGIHQNDNQNDDDDDASLQFPAFMIETIPCEDCRVLVPKSNWEIHRAHVCRGRQTRQQQQQLDSNGEHSSWDEYGIQIQQQHQVLPLQETAVCDTCGTLVPLINLELHFARCSGGIRSATTEAAFTERNIREENEPMDPYWSELKGPENSKSNDDDDGNSNIMEEWECPRCSYQNLEPLDSPNQSDWKCSACNYSLAEAMEQATLSTTLEKQQAQEPGGPSRWQTFVTSWVPREYHALLMDEKIVQENNRKEKQKRKAHRKSQRQRPPPSPPTITAAPSWQVRHQRNAHLTMLERERQQYLQLLQTTRREKQMVKERLEVIEAGNDESMFVPDKSTVSNTETDVASARDNTTFDDNPSPPPSQPQQHSSTQQQHELLQATEQLCLYHLEHIRRTSLIHDLENDICLLGLPRWRKHLHHLLDLYQTASELYVDNIIWEVRMHFSYYATLEVMALLELKIWKEQMLQLDIVSLESTEASLALRQACRNDQDVGIICRSVLPFLGRPQTRALRFM